MKSLISHFLVQMDFKKAKTALFLFTVLITSTSIMANDKGKHGCSTSDLAGKWVFYTDVGHDLPALNKPLPLGLITALGTMNINRAGELEGVFDFNAENFPYPIESRLDLSFIGNATLNNDCRGRLTFVTSNGDARNDSFVLIGKKKIRAMSLRTDVIWTYTAERISKRSDN